MIHIVVSAVNIRKGGTLTILRDCLAALSARATAGSLKVTALVHSRELCLYPGIDYIEMPDTVRGWLRRLRCEYVTMKSVSRRIAPVDLWLSLHDTTPRVDARRQAVYCQTSFPFMRWRWRDFRMDFKIPLFAMFTRFAYRINVHSNSSLIVQQQWLRKGLSRMLGVAPEKFIVAPPQPRRELPDFTPRRFPVPAFIYAATPDCHKNFEILCEAARLLEESVGTGRFCVLLTVDGTENRYARWLKSRWGHVSSIIFGGLLARPDLYAAYAGASCLVFPSRIETWGLPISEFMHFGKPMILADLPYARETSAGSPLTAFFNPESAAALKELMHEVLLGRLSGFAPVPPAQAEPDATGWPALIDMLLQS